MNHPLLLERLLLFPRWYRSIEFADQVFCTCCPWTDRIFCLLIKVESKNRAAMSTFLVVRLVFLYGGYMNLKCFNRQTAVSGNYKRSPTTRGTVHSTACKSFRDEYLLEIFEHYVWLSFMYAGHSSVRRACTTATNLNNTGGSTPFYLEHCPATPGPDGTIRARNIDIRRHCFGDYILRLQVLT